MFGAVGVGLESFRKVLLLFVMVVAIFVTQSPRLSPRPQAAMPPSESIFRGTQGV
jgi:hypothetical protein